MKGKLFSCGHRFIVNVQGKQRVGVTEDMGQTTSL